MFNFFNNFINRTKEKLTSVRTSIKDRFIRTYRFLLDNPPYSEIRSGTRTQGIIIQAHNRIKNLSIRVYRFFFDNPPELDRLVGARRRGIILLFIDNPLKYTLKPYVDLVDTIIDFIKKTTITIASNTVLRSMLSTIKNNLVDIITDIKVLLYDVPYFYFFKLVIKFVRTYFDDNDKIIFHETSAPEFICYNKLKNNVKIFCLLTEKKFYSVYQPESPNSRRKPEIIKIASSSSLNTSKEYKKSPPSNSNAKIPYISSNFKPVQEYKNHFFDYNVYKGVYKPVPMHFNYPISGGHSEFENRWKRSTRKLNLKGLEDVNSISNEISGILSEFNELQPYNTELSRHNTSNTESVNEMDSTESVNEMDSTESFGPNVNISDNTDLETKLEESLEVEEDINSNQKELNDSFITEENFKKIYKFVRKLDHLIIDSYKKRLTMEAAYDGKIGFIIDRDACVDNVPVFKLIDDYLIKSSKGLTDQHLNHVTQRYSLESEIHKINSENINAILDAKKAYNILDKIANNPDIKTMYDFCEDLSEARSATLFRMGNKSVGFNKKQIEFISKLYKEINSILSPNENNTNFTPSDMEQRIRDIENEMMTMSRSFSNSLKTIEDVVKNNKQIIKNAENTINNNFKKLHTEIFPQLQNLEKKNPDIKLVKDINDLIKIKLSYLSEVSERKTYLNKSTLNLYHSFAQIDIMKSEQQELTKKFVNDEKRMFALRNDFIEILSNPKFVKQKFYKKLNFKKNTYFSNQFYYINKKSYSSDRKIFFNNKLSRKISYNLALQNIKIKKQMDLREKEQQKQKQQEGYLDLDLFFKEKDREEEEEKKKIPKRLITVDVEKQVKLYKSNKPLYKIINNKVIGKIKPNENIYKDIDDLSQVHVTPYPISYMKRSVTVKKPSFQLNFIKKCDEIFPLPLLQIAVPSLIHYSIMHNPYIFTSTLILLNQLNKKKLTDSSSKSIFTYNKDAQFDNLILEEEFFDDIAQNKDLKLDLNINIPQIDYRLNCYSQINFDYKKINDKELINALTKKVKLFVLLNNRSNFEECISNVNKIFDSIEEEDKVLDSEELELLKVVVPNKLATFIDETHEHIVNNYPLSIPGTKLISKDDPHIYNYDTYDINGINIFDNYSYAPLFLRDDPNVKVPLDRGYFHDVEKQEKLYKSNKATFDKYTETNIPKLKYEAIKMFSEHELILSDIKKNLIFTDDQINLTHAFQMHRTQINKSSTLLFNHKLYLQRQILLGKGSRNKVEYQKLISEYNYIYHRLQILEKLDLGYNHEIDKIFSDINNPISKELIDYYNKDLYLNIVELPTIDTSNYLNPAVKSIRTEIENIKNVTTDQINNIVIDTDTIDIDQTLFNLNINDELLDNQINQINNSIQETPFYLTEYFKNIMQIHNGLTGFGEGSEFLTTQIEELQRLKGIDNFSPQERQLFIYLNQYNDSEKYFPRLDSMQELFVSNLFNYYFKDKINLFTEKSLLTILKILIKHEKKKNTQLPISLNFKNYKNMTKSELINNLIKFFNINTRNTRSFFFKNKKHKLYNTVDRNNDVNKELKPIYENEKKEYDHELNKIKSIEKNLIPPQYRKFRNIVLDFVYNNKFSSTKKKDEFTNIDLEVKNLLKKYHDILNNNNNLEFLDILTKLKNVFNGKKDALKKLFSFKHYLNKSNVKRSEYIKVDTKTTFIKKNKITQSNYRTIASKPTKKLKSLIHVNTKLKKITKVDNIEELINLKTAPVKVKVEPKSDKKAPGIKLDSKTIIEPKIEKKPDLDLDALEDIIHFGIEQKVLELKKTENKATIDEPIVEVDSGKNVKLKAKIEIENKAKLKTENNNKLTDELNVIEDKYKKIKAENKAKLEKSLATINLKYKNIEGTTKNKIKLKNAAYRLLLKYKNKNNTDISKYITSLKSKLEIEYKRKFNEFSVKSNTLKLKLKKINSLDNKLKKLINLVQDIKMKNVKELTIQNIVKFGNILNLKHNKIRLEYNKINNELKALKQAEKEGILKIKELIGLKVKSTVQAKHRTIIEIQNDLQLKQAYEINQLYLPKIYEVIQLYIKLYEEKLEDKGVLKEINLKRSDVIRNVTQIFKNIERLTVLLTKTNRAHNKEVIINKVNRKMLYNILKKRHLEYNRVRIMLKKVLELKEDQKEVHSEMRGILEGFKVNQDLIKTNENSMRKLEDDLSNLNAKLTNTLDRKDALAHSMNLMSGEWTRLKRIREAKCVRADKIQAYLMRYGRSLSPNDLAKLTEELFYLKERIIPGINKEIENSIEHADKLTYDFKVACGSVNKINEYITQQKNSFKDLESRVSAQKTYSQNIISELKSKYAFSKFNLNPIEKMLELKRQDILHSVDTKKFISMWNKIKESKIKLAKYIEIKKYLESKRASHYFYIKLFKNKQAKLDLKEKFVRDNLPTSLFKKQVEQIVSKQENWVKIYESLNKKKNEELSLKLKTLKSSQFSKLLNEFQDMKSIDFKTKLEQYSKTSEASLLFKMQNNVKRVVQIDRLRGESSKLKAKWLLLKHIKIKNSYNKIYEDSQKFYDKLENSYNEFAILLSKTRSTKVKSRRYKPVKIFDNLLCNIRNNKNFDTKYICELRQDLNNLIKYHSSLTTNRMYDAPYIFYDNEMHNVLNNNRDSENILQYSDEYFYRLDQIEKLIVVRIKDIQSEFKRLIKRHKNEKIIYKIVHEYLACKQSNMQSISQAQNLLRNRYAQVIYYLYKMKMERYKDIVSHAYKRFYFFKSNKVDFDLIKEFPRTINHIMAFVRIHKKNLDGVYQLLTDINLIKRVLLEYISVSRENTCITFNDILKQIISITEGTKGENISERHKNVLNAISKNEIDANFLYNYIINFSKTSIINNKSISFKDLEFVLKDIADEINDAIGTNILSNSFLNITNSSSKIITDVVTQTDPFNIKIIKQPDKDIKKLSKIVEPQDKDFKISLKGSSLMKLLGERVNKATKVNEPFLQKTLTPITEVKKPVLFKFKEDSILDKSESPKTYVRVILTSDPESIRLHNRRYKFLINKPPLRLDLKVITTTEPPIYREKPMFIRKISKRKPIILDPTVPHYRRIRKYYSDSIIVKKNKSEYSNIKLKPFKFDRGVFDKMDVYLKREPEVITLVPPKRSSFVPIRKSIKEKEVLDAIHMKNALKSIKIKEKQISHANNSILSKIGSKLKSHKFISIKDSIKIKPNNLPKNYKLQNHPTYNKYKNKYKFLINPNTNLESKKSEIEKYKQFTNLSLNEKISFVKTDKDKSKEIIKNLSLFKHKLIIEQTIKSEKISPILQKNLNGLSSIVLENKNTMLTIIHDLINKGLLNSNILLNPKLYSSWFSILPLNFKLLPKSKQTVKFITNFLLNNQNSIDTKKNIVGYFQVEDKKRIPITFDMMEVAIEKFPITEIMKIGIDSLKESNEKDIYNALHFCLYSKSNEYEYEYVNFDLNEFILRAIFSKNFIKNPISNDSIISTNLFDIKSLIYQDSIFKLLTETDTISENIIKKDGIYANITMQEINDFCKRLNIQKFNFSVALLMLELKKADIALPNLFQLDINRLSNELLDVKKNVSPLVELLYDENNSVYRFINYIYKQTNDLYNINIDKINLNNIYNPFINNPSVNNLYANNPLFHSDFNSKQIIKLINLKRNPYLDQMTLKLFLTLQKNDLSQNASKKFIQLLGSGKLLDNFGNKNNTNAFTYIISQLNNSNFFELYNSKIKQLFNIEGQNKLSDVFSKWLALDIVSEKDMIPLEERFDNVHRVLEHIDYIKYMSTLEQEMMVRAYMQLLSEQQYEFKILLWLLADQTIPSLYMMIKNTYSKDRSLPNYYFNENEKIIFNYNKLGSELKQIKLNIPTILKNLKSIVNDDDSFYYKNKDLSWWFKDELEPSFIITPNSNVKLAKDFHFYTKTNDIIDLLNLIKIFYKFNKSINPWDKTIQYKEFEPLIEINSNFLKDVYNICYFIRYYNINIKDYIQTQIKQSINFYNTFVNDIKRGFISTQNQESLTAETQIDVANNNNNSIIHNNMNNTTINHQPIISRSSISIKPFTLIKTNNYNDDGIIPYISLKSAQIKRYTILPLISNQINIINFNAKIIEFSNLIKHYSRNVNSLRPLTMTPNRLINKKRIILGEIMDELNFDAEVMLNLSCFVKDNLKFFYRLFSIKLPKKQKSITSYFKISYEKISQSIITLNQDNLIFKLLKIQNIEPQLKIDIRYFLDAVFRTGFGEYLQDTFFLVKNNIFLSEIVKVEDKYPFLNSPLKQLGANILLKVNDGIDFTFRFVGIKGNLTQITIFTDKSYISFFHILKLKNLFFKNKGLFFIPNYLIKKTLKTKKTLLVRNQTQCYFIKQYELDNNYQINHDIYIISGDNKPVQAFTKLSSYHEMLNPEIRSLLQFDFGYIKLENMPFKTSMNSKFTLNVNYKIHIDKSFSSAPKIGLYLNSNTLSNKNNSLVFVHLIKQSKDYLSIFGIYVRNRLRNNLLRTYITNELFYNKFKLKLLFLEQKIINIFSYQKHSVIKIIPEWRSIIVTSDLMKLTAQWLHMYRNREFVKNVNRKVYNMLKTYNTVDKIYAAPYKNYTPFKPVCFQSRLRYILFSKLNLPNASAAYLPKFLFEDKEFRLLKVFANLNIIRRRLKSQLEYYLYFREYRYLSRISEKCKLKNNDKYKLPLFDHYFNKNIKTNILREFNLSKQDLSIKTNNKFLSDVSQVENNFKNITKFDVLKKLFKFILEPLKIKFNNLIAKITNKISMMVDSISDFYQGSDIKNLLFDVRRFCDYVYVKILRFKIFINKEGWTLFAKSILNPKILSIQNNLKLEKKELMKIIYPYTMAIPYWNYHFTSIFTQFFRSYSRKSKILPLINTTPSEMSMFSKGQFLNLTNNVIHKNLFNIFISGDKYSFLFKSIKQNGLFFRYNKYLLHSSKTLFNLISNSKNVLKYHLKLKQFSSGIIIWSIQNNYLLIQLIPPRFRTKKKYYKRLLNLTPYTANIDKKFFAGDKLKSERVHRNAYGNSKISLSFLSLKSHLSIGKYDKYDTFKTYADLDASLKNKTNAGKIKTNNKITKKCFELFKYRELNLEVLTEESNRNRNKRSRLGVRKIKALRKKLLKDFKEFYTHPKYEKKNIFDSYFSKQLMKHILKNKPFNPSNSHHVRIFKKYDVPKKNVLLGIFGYQQLVEANDPFNPYHMFTTIIPLIHKIRLKGSNFVGIDWKLYNKCQKIFPNILEFTVQVSSNIEEHVETVDQTEHSKVPAVEQKNTAMITTKEKTPAILTKNILYEFYEAVNDFVQSDVISWITFHEYREELLRKQTEIFPTGMATQVLWSFFSGTLSSFMVFAADYRRAPVDTRAGLRLFSFKFFIIFCVVSMITYVFLDLGGMDIVKDLFQSAYNFFFGERIPQRAAYKPEFQHNYPFDSFSYDTYRTSQCTQYNEKIPKKQLKILLGIKNNFNFLTKF